MGALAADWSAGRKVADWLAGRMGAAASADIQTGWPLPLEKTTKSFVLNIIVIIL